MERFERHNDDLWFSATDWAKLLHLATLYGYDPTVLGPADGTSAEELGNLAVAVECALDDVPNHNATGNKSAARMSPYEWFSGARKEKLREFLRFCKESRILGSD